MSLSLVHRSSSFYLISHNNATRQRVCDWNTREFQSTVQSSTQFSGTLVQCTNRYITQFSSIQMCTLEKVSWLVKNSTTGQEMHLFPFSLFPKFKGEQPSLCSYDDMISATKRGISMKVSRYICIYLQNHNMGWLGRGIKQERNGDGGRWTNWT